MKAQVLDQDRAKGMWFTSDTGVRFQYPPMAWQPHFNGLKQDADHIFAIDIWLSYGMKLTLIGEQARQFFELARRNQA